MLETAGIESARSESLRLLETAAGTTYAQLLASGEIGSVVGERAIALAHRRARGVPLQYVTGTTGFRRLELQVGPGVLIPRPETEVVVERALSHMGQVSTVVDVGTGSGAIALAIADERPDARVLATERSPAAIAWAKLNRDALGHAVEVIECDLFAGLPRQLRAHVDVVVANPPYVTTSEMTALPAEVLEFEPHDALAGGPDGLEVARRIAGEAREWVRSGAWIVMEIGAGQGRAATALLTDLGYERVDVFPDLAGRPRVVEGQRS